MQFYTKDEAGEFQEATTDQIEELFRERSEKIIAKKLSGAREKESARIRSELEPEITKQVSEKVKEEALAEAKKSYEERINALTQEKAEVEVKLRRKTIAAEYGFKADAEEFLGNGTEDEMRAKADSLKDLSKNPSASFPDKKTKEQSSESEDKYGLDVKI